MAIDVNRTLLETGELVVTGRLIDASNATLYAKVILNSMEQICIYKPIAGERPLWDFPDGTLADREYAAYLVSDFLGLDVVPLTILRDGPYGVGMVQEWIDIDESIDLAKYFSQDIPELRRMAFFDAIVNNTDRKIGHLLPTATGKLYGCDHGVTFHEEDKLRTVLWQWANEPLTQEEISALEMLQNALGNELDLSEHLTPIEIQAIRTRVSTLIATATMPSPSLDWPAIPWPAF